MIYSAVVDEGQEDEGERSRGPFKSRRLLEVRTVRKFEEAKHLIREVLQESWLFAVEYQVHH
jgi:hypothetical protein